MKNKIIKEALENVPPEYRVLKNQETVQNTDWLWTSGEKHWIKADFLVGETKAREFICVIREQVLDSPQGV